MSYKFPFTNYHELNLTWVLDKLKELFAASEESVTVIETYNGRLTEVETELPTVSATAENAAQTAAAAASLAQTAKATADTAQENAIQAQASAGVARQEAQAAQTAANEATQAAQQAQAATLNFDGRITQAQNDATSALNKIGNLPDLGTENKNTVVAAINEILENDDSIEAELDNLKGAIGFRVINKEYGTRESAVFTKNKVAPNSTIYYSFSVPENRAGFLEIFDENNTRITYIGKGASVSGELDYEGVYTLPSNYSYAAFRGTSTAIITVHYLKAETNNDILLQKIDSAEINLEDLGELFAIGESILPQEDLYNTATTNTSFTSMWQTQKASGAVYTTKIVDLGTKAGRTYAVRNIYRIYAYDTDGTYITYMQSRGQYSDDVLDFTQYPHRYIRVVVNRNARFAHDVVIGSTIPNSTHRGKYPSNDLNLENLFSKRAFLYTGQLGSTQYRMPFCAYTNEGALLLGGEMRYASGADNKDISLAYTRSLDHGKTFETPYVLFEKNSGPETYHTKGCGQFVVDSFTGKIFCFCLREDSDVNRLTTLTDKAGYNSGILYKYSTDNGKTWSAEQEIDLRSSDMMIMCPSPGNGITMEDGTLVVPAWCQYSDGSRRSLIIYSSDHGNTWDWSGSTVPYSSNECTLVETETGTLLINCRCEETPYRVVYITTDKGATYTPHPSNLYSIKQAICSANLHKFFTDSGVGETVYLYTAPFNSNRSLTKLLCTKDFVNWKELCTITTPQTSGYTCIATYEDHLIVVEEWINNYLTCDSVRMQQTVFASQSLKIPAESGSFVPVRGELFYNVATDKLNFMDASGNVKVIAFES